MVGDDNHRTETREAEEQNRRHKLDSLPSLYRRRFLKGTIASSFAAGGLASAPDEVVAQETSDEDWPQFQFDTENTGHNPNGTGPTTGLGKLWNPFSTGGAVSSPVIVDNVVYVGSDDGNLYAVDASTGDEQWRFSTDGGITKVAPAVVSGVVYIGNDSETVYALDASDGSKLWEASTSEEDNGIFGLTVSSGTVFVGDADRLFAFDAADGTELWQVDTGECFGSGTSPAVADGVVYITEDCGKTWSLNASDGSVQWKFDDPSGPGQGSPPTVANGSVYFGTNISGREANTVFAIDADTGNEEWRFSFTPEGDVKSSPAVANGTVFFGSDNGNVYALDASDGTEAWSEPFSTDGSVTSSPSVVSGVVYVGSDDGNLYLLDASTGENIDQFGTGGAVGSSPAVVNGNVYVGSRDSKLYGLQEGEANESPTAAFDFTPDDPIVGEEVTFDPSASFDPDGSISTFGWDFDGDGNFDKTFFSDEKVTHTYSETGDFSVTLKVTDDDGAEDETTNIVSVNPKPNITLKEDSVRLVQTVENTRVNEIDYTEPEPEVVAGRNGAVVFDLEGENLDYLPKEINIDILINSYDDSDDDSFSFKLDENSIRDIDSGVDPRLVFDRNTTDQNSANNLPVFKVDDNFQEITLFIGAEQEDELNGDSADIQEGDEFTVASPRKLNVGFIQIQDPESGVNYGAGNQGTPRAYKRTVQKICEYLREAYPVSNLSVYREDSPLHGTENADDEAVSGDATHVRAVHNDPDQPENQCAEELDLQRAHLALSAMLPVDESDTLCGDEISEEEGFDVTAAVVPGADPEEENDDWFTFHGKDNYLGFELTTDTTQPQTAAVFLEEDGKTPLLDDQGNHLGYTRWRGMETVGAQEIAHHFTIGPYEGPAPTHPLAQRDDDGAETTVNGESTDWDHARDEDSDHNLDGTDDPPGIRSVGYDFSRGNFRVFTETSDNGDIKIKREQSFMSYAEVNQEDTNSGEILFTVYKKPLWVDTRIYQELINSNFEPHPPQEDFAFEEDSSTYSGCAWITNDGSVETASTFVGAGRPTPDINDGGVLFEVLDPQGDSIDQRNIPKKVKRSAHNSGSEEEIVENGTIIFDIPFPDNSTEVRIVNEENATKINPISKSIRDAIKRIPDNGFINRPDERREALFNKLDAVDKQMGEKKFRASREKMQEDIRDKLEKWLNDDYDTTVLQPTKQEMLDLVDDMIARLETLAEETS